MGSDSRLSSDLRLLGSSVALDPERAAALVRTVSEAEEFLVAAQSPRTRAAYASDWKQFRTWIESHGLPALPADPRMVALFASHLARAGQRKPSSIRRMLTTIGTLHKRAGHQNPCETEVVRVEMKGIRNVLGVRPKRAAPILIPHLEAIIGALGEDLRSVRDKAIILTGFAGALRRSEIAAIDVSDLAFLDKGIQLLLRQSKTDQAGEGQYVGLFHAAREALCPVRAIEAWRRAGGIESGPLFRQLSQSRRTPKVLETALTPHMVYYVVQSRAEDAGIQPEQLGQEFSPHSLRAGFITEAARAAKPEWTIQKQSRHRSAQVLRDYIRIADTFQGNAADGLL